MIESLDLMLTRDEMTISVPVDVVDEAKGRGTSSEGQEYLEQKIRSECRDIISASYKIFAENALEKSFESVYETEKQQAITALKETFQEKAAAAASAEERKLYLNYSRVAHLHFAQKTKVLDTLIACYNQDAPEPFFCSTNEKASDYREPIPFLGMAAGGRRRKKKKNGGNGDKNTSKNIIPLGPGQAKNSNGGLKISVVEATDYTELLVTETNNYIDTSQASFEANIDADRVFVDWESPTNPNGQDLQTTGPTLIPDEKTEEVPKQPSSGSPPSSYTNSQTPPKEQKSKSQGGLFRKVFYGGLVLTTLAASAVMGYAALYTSDSSRPQSPVTQTGGHSSYAPEITPLPLPLPEVALPVHLTQKITYEPTTAPAYDAENPAPWYQIEKATVRNDGKTVDLQLGPHLSQEYRVVRVNYDTNGDGKADRTKYVAAEEILSLSVSGKITDVGVGFVKEESPGFTYHASVRFDR